MGGSPSSSVIYFYLFSNQGGYLENWRRSGYLPGGEGYIADFLCHFLCLFTLDHIYIRRPPNRGKDLLCMGK